MNAHRHTLDDLDPVARGILRRQQGKRAAGARTDAVDRAAVFHAAAVNIRLNVYRLANAHLVQLGFLEVGVDP